MLDDFHVSDNVTTNNNNYLVSATAGDGYIIFECNISSSLDSESDILGCIAIVHNSDSSLIVNKIHKDNLTMNVSVEPGRTYPYSVFLWKMSGLLVNDPTEVIKGSVPINIPDQTASDSGIHIILLIICLYNNTGIYFIIMIIMHVSTMQCHAFINRVRNIEDD